MHEHGLCPYAVKLFALFFIFIFLMRWKKMLLALEIHAVKIHINFKACGLIVKSTFACTYVSAFYLHTIPTNEQYRRNAEFNRLVDWVVILLIYLWLKLLFIRFFQKLLLAIGTYTYRTHQMHVIFTTFTGIGTNNYLWKLF